MAPLPRTSGATGVLLAGTADWVAPLADALASHLGADTRIVRTADGARRVLGERPVDCLVCGYDLDGSTGVELLRAVRDEHPSLPVVLCTGSGSEAVASEAISAGVTDYVALSAPDRPAPEEVASRVEEAIEDGRRTQRAHTRAQQFHALFQDTRAATWVLDADGALERANRTARELCDRNVGDAVGEPFWTLAWWSQSSRLAADVRQLVETAVDGEASHAVVTHPPGGAVQQTVELSVHPVHDERDEVVSLVVEGVDITERVALEREIRRSEELHRVTLNNMTDTVLMTDDGGEYTYVCPNVHFIFGYTAEEIREFGTIDELLGENLFDRAELAEQGALKNIECTATDKAGREHTLLVNVREVSIQGGTLLYSCRDITKRKQREEALATLQETARDFLYAGTRGEIADHVVEDVPGTLDLDASAVYLLDGDGNELRPVAASPAMERQAGPLRAVRADDESLVGHSFVEDESLFSDDVHDDPRLENRATDVRSAAHIPLGDHGVFVAGTDEVGQFDEVTRELADLLAATAEAALDRVERERRLREQERELKRRNDELTALNRVNEIIREIDQALVQAETREEVEHAVCERLTDDDRFAFAWVGVGDARSETVEPRAWAGDEQGYLDSLPFEVGESRTEPAGRTAASGEVTTVTDVADGLREERWRTEALSREYRSVLSVPVAYDEFTYGVLTVYADARNAFDETSRAVLAELGETVASATSAIERKNALLTTSTTRVEIDVDDSSFVLARLAQEAGCALTYQGGVQQTPDGCYVFVTVEGDDVEAVERVAADQVAVAAVDRISAGGDEGVLRLHLTDPFLALELADHGAVLRSASADESATTLVVDVPESVDDRHIVGLLTETFAGVELRSKQTFDRSSGRTVRSRFLDRVTDRQLEVVQAAYYSGYFESPRESTGQEVAHALDISPQAFYQHTRTVQRKLFSTLFEDGGDPGSLSHPPGTPGGV